jgi:hypothetical protein
MAIYVYQQPTLADFGACAVYLVVSHNVLTKSMDASLEVKDQILL